MEMLYKQARYAAVDRDMVLLYINSGVVDIPEQPTWLENFSAL